MPTVPDLRSLIARVQAGDRRALATLYDAYCGQLTIYCSQRLPDATMARACVQAVFVEAWQAIASYSYESDLLFTAWLYKIANHVLAQSRWAWTPRHNPSRTQPQRSLIPSSRDTGDRTALFHALGHLTVEQQDVIALKFFVGLSNRDIATAMHRTEDAIKVLQHRAIDRLHHLTAI